MTITTPGKFEGEHESVPALWAIALDGNGEDVQLGHTLYTFLKLAEHPDAWVDDGTGAAYGVVLWETERGFVQALWLQDERDYQKTLDEALAEAENAE